MSNKKLTQIEPVIDPKQPKTDNRYSYYILEEPKSPSVTPPNALRVVQYKRRQFLHDDPDDFRRPYGFAEYENELSFAELDKYNLLPFDREQIILFDLWQSFDKDNVKLSNFFTQFFKVTAGDPDRRRLGLATKLLGKEWTLKKAREAIKGIK